MIKYLFYPVILWTNLLLVDLSIFSNSQEFKSIAYIKSDDPHAHVEELTYSRLTFLRGCLVQEQLPNWQENHNKKCTADNHTRYYHHPSDSLIYERLRCNGNMFSCIAVKQFAIAMTMRIDNQFYGLAINDEFNKLIIKQLHNRSVKPMKQILSIKNTDLGDVCKCYCDDESNKDIVRSFCQDIVETDLGYVITGVRFKTIKQIVYLEVQQGQLVNGNIDLNTVHWKQLQTCSLYGVLNYSHRSVQLDDVLVPRGYAITGLMWVRYHQRTGYLGFQIGRFVLGVKITKMDNHGNLIPDEWLIREKVSARRRLLHVFNQYILSSPTNKSQELSMPNKHYIKFRTTSWAEDFAQHVVPFIDLQEVVSNSSKPIIGVGVYYRSSYQYGGFIAPKLIVEN